MNFNEETLLMSISLIYTEMMAGVKWTILHSSECEQLLLK